jgi:hypothetical protein
MVAVQALTALLALAASPLLVRADVTPSEPGPGSSFNAGTTCRVTWEGDKDSTTAWKDMAIQLMSGSNTAMVHVTTVTTNQDGTVDGRFEYPCPEVNPYSAIYFYQFTSTHTTTKTWTTRFTIASASGATTPPANANQPGSNDPIPWGTGALADTSKAVAPPPSAGGTGAPAGNSTTSGSATGGPINTGSATTTPKLTTSSKPSSTANTSTTANSAVNTGAATALTGVDSRMWLGAVGAFVFAAFL